MNKDRRNLLFNMRNLFLLSLLPNSLFALGKNEKIIYTENVVKPTDIKELKEYLLKMSQPDMVHKSDIFVTQSDKLIFKNIRNKLYELQQNIGFGNFTFLSFEDIFKTNIFTLNEKNYIETMFSYNATKYGFFGDKPLQNLFKTYNNNKFIKIDGIFILENQALNKYKTILNTIGDTIYITSGIRNIPKQFLLFMDKAIESNFNLSMASRTLAPPGYSYHGVGDFDIGKRGLGAKNFTESFAETNEFKLAVEKGFIDIRYDKNNLLGVRFEPWHIKV